MGIIDKIREDISILRGNLLVLIVSWVIMFFGTHMAWPFESPYIRALGASPSLIGVLGSIGMAILFLVRIPGSYIADRYGRRRIIAIMTFGVGVSYLFYALAIDWRMVLIGIILMNLCLIYQPALEAITADSIPPEKRGLGFALTRLIPEATGIFAPAVAGYLTESMGLVSGMRVIYLIITILTLSAAAIRYLFLKETLGTPEEFRLDSIKRIYIESIHSLIDAWRAAPRTLKILTIVLMLSSFEDPIYMNFASLYVLDKVSVTKLEWGYVNTLYMISGLLLGIPLGKLIDKIGRKNSIVLSYLIFSPITLWFIYARSYLELAIIFLLFGIGGILIGPSFNALTADLAPREMRGRIMGVIGNLNLLSAMLSSTIAGLLYDIDPALPFYLTLIIGIICLLIVSIFIKEPTIRME